MYARELAGALGGTLVVLDDATRIYRIALRPGGAVEQVDVAQLQGRGIEEDLQRRDFTLNALALELGPGGGRLIDPRGGAKDLKRRVLRASGSKPFQEDPIRVLRAFRLAAQLDLTIEPATLRAIRANARRLKRCAGERIRQELLGLLSVSPCRPWLDLLDRAGALTQVFPELEPARRCALAYYGAGGVLRHTLDVAARMDFLLDRLDAVLPGLASGILEQTAAWTGAGAPARLRLACLLHDIAKPATARRIGGRLRFFGHDEKGARMSRRILERLRFSGAETDGICACVLHHLRPGNLAVNDVITPKAIYRFFRDLGPHGVPLLLVCWADHASYLDEKTLIRLLPRVSEAPDAPAPRAKDPDVLKTLRHLRVVAVLLRSFFERKDVVRPPRLLDGHAVMKALGLPPGPKIGKAIRRLEEAQAEGKVRDAEQAVRFLAKLKLR